jgi:hypothetical protein
MAIPVRGEALRCFTFRICVSESASPQPSPGKNGESKN